MGIPLKLVMFKLLIAVIVVTSLPGCNQRPAEENYDPIKKTFDSNVSNAIKRPDTTKCNCESLYKDKKHGELLAIVCNYITIHKIPPPLNPCKLSVTRTDSIKIKGIETYLIKLSCCQIGDEFMIDKNTMQVIDYTPGYK